MKSQSSACGTVSHKLRLVTRACNCPTNRVRVTQRCDDFCAAPSTVVFLALLIERNDYKNCCEVLSSENQCISAHAPEAKRLREKVAEPEKRDVVLKSTSKGRER